VVKNGLDYNVNLLNIGYIGLALGVDVLKFFFANLEFVSEQCSFWKKKIYLTKAMNFFHFISYILFQICA